MSGVVVGKTGQKSAWASDTYNGRCVSSYNEVHIGGDNLTDIILQVHGRRISLSDLINRLEALEQAYMEDKLLGTREEPGKIET